MTNLLEYRNVSKVFRIGSMLRGKKLVAVDRVSFNIPADKPDLDQQSAVLHPSFL